MFSYEDWLQAAKLYIKLGKRIGLTIRQLGYPTKNSLRSGYREYERCQDLSAGYVRQSMYSDADSTEQSNITSSMVAASQRPSRRLAIPLGH